jgi:glycosyltransferase involved in cell wall biosynthesis
MISVIIPAYNEEKYLVRTLRSIADQTMTAELIVVANGCTDKTIEVALGYADRVFKIDKHNVALARNIGALNSKGDILVFLDADTRLSPNALQEISKQFSDDYAAATLDAYPNAPRTKYQLVLSIKNLLHRTKLYAGSSGVIITHSNLFDKVHGFDPHLPIGENSMIIRQLKKFGKYCVVDNTYATTSTRRYERWGLVRTLFFWVYNRWILHRAVRYEAVR